MGLRSVLKTIPLIFYTRSVSPVISKPNLPELEFNHTEVEKVEEEYLEAGINFALEVSYSYLGKYEDFKALTDLWVKKEEEYAKFGFKTVSFDVFLEAALSGKPVNKSLLRQLRKLDEFPIRHSKIYQSELSKQFLKENSPIVDPSECKNGGTQKGTFQLPSTEKPGQYYKFRFKIQTSKFR